MTRGKKHDTLTYRIEQAHGYSWNRSRPARFRLSQKGLLHNGRLIDNDGLTRHLIERDTPINGGAYVGSGEHEIIVVDDTKRGSRIYEVWLDLQARLFERACDGQLDPRTATQSVVEIVRERLPERSHWSEYEQFIAMHGLERDQRVSLDFFVYYEIGVCRTEALLSSYLIEKLIREWDLHASVSNDRASRHRDQFGHAWTRFCPMLYRGQLVGDARTPLNLPQYDRIVGSPQLVREVWICDASHQAAGPLIAVNLKRGWDYRRPEEARR